MSVYLQWVKFSKNSWSKMSICVILLKMKKSYLSHLQIKKWKKKILKIHFKDSFLLKRVHAKNLLLWLIRLFHGQNYFQYFHAKTTLLLISKSMLCFWKLFGWPINFCTCVHISKLSSITWKMRSWRKSSRMIWNSRLN